MTLWTVTRRAPLSVVFSSGLPCPLPKDLPNPGIEPTSLVSPALQADSLPTEPPGKPVCLHTHTHTCMCTSCHSSEAGFSLSEVGFSERQGSCRGGQCDTEARAQILNFSSSEFHPWSLSLPHRATLRKLPVFQDLSFLLCNM